jgi:drug/metabolite transporter (DMT)-like permease
LSPPIVTARLSVLAAALLFGTGGAAIKGTTLTSIQVAGFRSGVAALAMLALLPDARRGFTRELVPAALAYAATLVLFVIATKLTTSSAAIFLQSTAPLWVVALSPLLLQEPIDRREAPYLVAAALGLLLVFLGSQDAVATAPSPQLGNACALASGLSFALLLLYFRRLSRADPTRDRSLTAATVGNVLACALSLPFALPVARATASDVFAILYLGTMQVGLAYFFLSRGLRALPALEVSLLLLLEPVLNPVWTWLLHDERPTPLALTGGAVLLVVLATRARMTAARA